jgi:Tol biopolymer transport system component
MGLTGMLLLGLGACGEVPTQATDSGGIRVSVAAASTGFVQCGEEIPVTATVTDGKGKVLTGFLVNFRVLDGGGSMFAGSALTDNKGQARDYWTIGSGANLGNTLEVRAVNATTGDKNTYFTQTVTTLSKIAFASNRDGNYEIYVMNPDSTGVTRVTNSALRYDGYPAWSPNGSRIAFAQGSGEFSTDIYVMNADGTGQTNLTNHPAYHSRPAWSPDGRRIAFSSSRDGLGEIYVMNADGTAPVNLTNSPEASDAWPTWSPDGSRIAFGSTGEDENPEIYVMNADGTGQTNLTNHPGSDHTPAWSPDGKKIAFTANHGSAVFSIYVMNADGTEQTRLTNYAVNDQFPAWSPDGRKIASMLTFPYMQTSIKVMNADGTAPTVLTSGTDGNNNGFPAWSGCTVP